MPDGNCVICDDNDGTTIAGTQGVDVICGAGGNDEINGNEGADKIEGGDGDDTLYGVGGADQLLGGAGANLIYGGPGNDVIHISTSASGVAYGDGDDDTIWGSPYDDSIFGGSGDDVLLSAGGADFLSGDAGNDAISPFPVWSGPVADDVIGSVFCGGAGNDSINGEGARHVCVDAGTGTDTCRYSFNVSPSRSQETTDLGTESGCETVTSGYAFNSSRSPDCGCP